MGSVANCIVTNPSLSQASVFSTGGGGIHFENSVKAAFAIAMALRLRVPGLPEGEIISLRHQAKSEGYQVDDLLLRFKSISGTNYTLLAQIKFNLVFSAHDEQFKKIVAECWADFRNDLKFNPEIDRILLIKSGLTNRERNHIRVVLDWARAKASLAEFFRELNTSKEKLDIFYLFKTTIEGLNNSTDNVEDEKVWTFLKCLGLIDFDLGTDDSVDQTHFRNLIKLSLKGDLTANPDAIWGIIFEAISKDNFLGATKTPEQFRKQFDFFTIPNQSILVSGVDKLKRDSELLFEKIGNTIGEVHLERGEVFREIQSRAADNRFLIISGVAGVGKSAFAKELIDKSDDSCVFAFAADQFNRSRLSQTLSEVGIHDAIEDLFARFSLLRNKIVYVDSFEKLLEGDGDAFRELLVVTKKYSDIRIVVTCRDYAVELLKFKFFTDPQSVKTMHVPILSDDEMTAIKSQIPQLSGYLANTRIKALLKIPKYLDFAFRLSSKMTPDQTSLDEVGFKHKLWEVIVRNEMLLRDNLPDRRSIMFVEIAFQRAKQMTLYASLSNPDSSAVSALLADGIIVKSDDKYSPAHDILEDWALIRYIQKLKSESNVDFEFISRLGSQPAIRRGFRLWIENVLLETPQVAYAFVKSILFDKDIDQHWKDEIIIAVLNSDLCAKFFEENSEVLLNNDGILLANFIHLLRVACKSDRNLPKGQGWSVAIIFINNNLAEVLSANIKLIFGLLLDWEIRFVVNPKATEARAAGLIMLALLDLHLTVKEEKLSDYQVASAVDFLFTLTEVVQQELYDLFAESIKDGNDSQRQDWRKSNFDEKIVEHALSSLHSGLFPKYYPSDLINLAKSEWVASDAHETRYRSNGDVNIDFGLADESRRNYFPASAYATFVFKLFRHHPHVALEFTTDFVNTASAKYISSDLFKDIPKIEVKLYVGGTIKKQWGSSVLWSMFRGTGTVTPYLLQSLLMAFERYLYESGESGTEVGKTNIRYCFDYVYEHSTSVATTAVLASIAMAFPSIVGEKFLPLLSVKEFYGWDSTRWLNDKTVFKLPPTKNDDLVFEEERDQANKWAHRTKFNRGLIGFIIDYQFNVRVINPAIFDLIDRLKKRPKKSDLQWKKILNEIDVREWSVEHNKKESRLELQVDYKGDVKEMVDSFREEQEKSNEAAGFSLWIQHVFENKEPDEKTFDRWIQCYQYYLRYPEGISPALFARPGTLAVLGLRDFNFEIDQIQRTWCIDTICDYVSRSMKRQDSFEIDLTRNIMDARPVFGILPSLLLYRENISVEKILDIKTLIFVALADLHQELHKKDLVTGVRNLLWDVDKNFAMNCFCGLMEYAVVVNKSRIGRWNDSSIAETAARDRESIILRVIADVAIPFSEVTPMNYQTHSSFILDTVFEIVSPKASSPQFDEFLLFAFVEHLNALTHRDRLHSSTGFYETGMRIQRCIAQYLLLIPIERSMSLFNGILNRFSIQDETVRERNQFVRDTLERIYLELDNFIGTPDESIATISFWHLWQALLNQINDSESKKLVNEWLLECRFWRSDAEHWKPLEQSASIYPNNIPKLEYCNVNALVKLTGGIGSKTLLPDGITWIVFFLKGSPFQQSLLEVSICEKLAMRAYRNNTQVIKGNISLLEDFIWLLDILINKGSSKAYLIRENILLYKIVVDR